MIYIGSVPDIGGEYFARGHFAHPDQNNLWQYPSHRTRGLRLPGIQFPALENDAREIWELIKIRLNGPNLGGVALQAVTVHNAQDLYAGAIITRHPGTEPFTPDSFAGSDYARLGGNTIALTDFPHPTSIPMLPNYFKIARLPAGQVVSYHEPTTFVFEPTELD